jgi:hypothetical protein
VEDVTSVFRVDDYAKQENRMKQAASKAAWENVGSYRSIRDLGSQTISLHWLVKKPM